MSDIDELYIKAKEKLEAEVSVPLRGFLFLTKSVTGAITMIIRKFPSPYGEFCF